eukprot:TRINITY_DN22817_c0_g1_i1.p1 TRINITY_DN22817_c0_g1~~TRINITY_DN22817_c0_g1_i1.p1  ORF type:complete len:1068 (+),score=342.38 TRINITY_DN22817_c0_g1_i1:97-3300(+)
MVVVDAFDESNVEAEEEPDPTAAVEITWIDPRDGSVCKQDVFADPKDWATFHKARLLVSSDLVNLYSEASIRRHGRFDVWHSKLQKARFGYSVDLIRIRKIVARILKSLPKEVKEEDADVPLDKEEKEVCPVHFFITTQYMDNFESVCLQKCIDKLRRMLEEDLKELRSRMAKAQGGGWRDLMEMVLKGGHNPLELCEQIFDRKQPSETFRKELENKRTNGARDKHDELQKTLKAFDALLEDEDGRTRDLDLKSRQISAQMDMKRKKIEELKEKLRVPPVTENLGKIDRSVVQKAERKEQQKEQDIGPLVAQLMAKYEADAKKAQMAMDHLKRKLKQWRDRAMQPDPEAEMLAKLLKEWQEKLAALEQQNKTLFAKLAMLERRWAELEKQLKEMEEAIAALEGKLEGCGGKPDPRAFKLLELKKLLEELKKKFKAMQKDLQRRLKRIAAMQATIKEIYAKLGWSAPTQEHEVEEEGELENKPYWMRRKAAEISWPDGPKRGLYAALFVEKEKAYKQKRLEQAMSQGKKEHAAKIKQQMEAKRIKIPGRGGASSREGSPGRAAAEEDAHAAESSALPFAKDARDEDPLASSVGFKPSWEELRLLPAWAHDAKQQSWRCTLMVQLQELRSSFEEKMRRTAAAFAEALPAGNNNSGAPLGGLHVRLAPALAKLAGNSIQLPSLWEDVGAEDDDVDQAAADIEVIMEEAVTLGGEVATIQSSMEHAVAFKELRARLAEVRLSVKRLRSDLQLVAAARTSFGLSVSPRAIHASAAAARHQLGRRGSKAAALPLEDGGDQWSRTSSGDLLVPSGGSSPTGGSGVPRSPGGGMSLRRGPGSLSAAGIAPLQDSEMLAGQLAPISSPSERSPAASRNGGRVAWQASSPSGGYSPQQMRMSKMPARTSTSSGQRLEVDFGFRPDGVGEESLESWSLFKVSKQSDMSTTLPSAGGTWTTSSSKALNQSKATRRAAGRDLDFRQYVNHVQQNPGQDMWRSASTPSLLEAQARRCPSLPSLVTNGGGGEASQQPSLRSKSRSQLLKEKSEDLRCSFRSKEWKVRASATATGGSSWLSRP